MRSRLLFVALLGFFALSQAAPSPPEWQWKLFKAEFSKEYQSVAEEGLRMKIFAENVLAMEKHNIRYQAGEVSFETGINQFSDMLSSEVRSMNGYKMSDKPDQATATFVALDSHAELPESIDWRSKGLVTAVKDQEYCGSCWAFSTTGSLEGQHAKKTGKLVSLSEQQLVDCTYGAHYGNYGCWGGRMAFSYRYIIFNGGIDTEESYPYKGIQQARCYYNSTNIGATMVGFVRIQSKSEQALKQAVATVGPISVTIDASSSSFASYKSGIYYNPKCSELKDKLDHAVLVVGYGTEDGHDYWLVKNSWSEKWGMKGYIKMSRNRNNNCGIATIASYPTV